MMISPATKSVEKEVPAPVTAVEEPEVEIEPVILFIQVALLLQLLVIPFTLL